MRDSTGKTAIGRAFTLVELLVVIAIIALLVGILVPVLSKAIEQAEDTRTQARVAEVAGGCNAYHAEHECYPGQEYPAELRGSSPAGSFTGSQWLARALFTDPSKAAGDDYPYSRYAPVKADGDLIDPIQGGYHTISDRNRTGRDPMPLLYYPARLGVSGLAQYKYNDNSTHSDPFGGSSSNFRDFITDTRFGGSNTPYGDRAFLIIAAGMDQTYFTKDDIRYPAFKSE